MEERIEVKERRKLRKLQDTGNWKGNSRSQSMEGTLWNRLWTCCKTDYAMMMMMMTTTKTTTMHSHSLH